MRPPAELDLPLALDRAAGLPLHQQLAAALRSAVLDGLLPPGSRVPPSRLLGTQLRIARSTVLTAYEQLTGEGYLESRHGSGTFVPEQVHRVPTQHPRPAGASTADDTADDTPDRAAVDLRPGRPDTRRLVDGAWRAAWRDATGRDVPPVEPPAQGLPALREQIAAHLRAARGVIADPADVLVTAGTGDGLALIAHALGGPPPRLVAVEDPGYPAARRILTRLGWTVQPVPVDDDGLLVDRLPDLPVPPHLVLVTPSHQYPLGGCLPVSRRLDLLSWARRTGGVIVEDDYDSEYRFGAAPLPALAALDGDGQVVHLGTFSKVLSPWLRAGYLLAPPGLRRTLVAVRDDLGTPVSGITQQALSTYLASGAVQRHIARARRDYGHRRRHLTLLLAAHPHLQLRGTRAGLHAVIDLPAGTDVPAVLRRCARSGFLLADLRDYDALPHAVTRPGVALGYGDATLDELERAVTALASAAREAPLD